MSIDTTPPVAPSIALLQDSGSSNSDRITNNKAITGSTEAGALVVLYEGSMALASATAASDGSWTIASGVADGAHTLRAVASDAAGNSAASVDLVATFDTLAPDAQLGLTNATDTGTKGDGITATSKPILTGTAESNSSIILYRNGVAFGSNPFSADAWSRGTNLASGSATFSVAVSDVAGNSTSRTLLVSIDTTPPAAPGGVLQAGSDSGTLGDRITRYTTQVFGGSTDPGAVVSVVEAGTTLGVATAAADGSWSVTLSLGAGVHSLASTATDAAGNLSAISNRTLTIDTLPPQVPSVDLDAASDGIVAHDGLTSSAAPVLQGTTDAGAVVVLQEGTTQLGSAIANTAGLWSFTSSLSHGTHQLTATAVDGEGNSSAATGFSLTVDTVAPDAPGIGLDTDIDSGIPGDGLTNSTYPVLSGTAEAGSTVFLYEDGQQFDQAVASSTGNWAVNSAFLAGAHTVTAVAVDAAGNSSAAGDFTLSIDTTPPAAPSVGLTAATDGGAKGDGLTNTTTPVLTGTAEAGGYVAIYEGATLLTSVATGSGAWTTSLSLSAGVHNLQAVAFDAAGNGAATGFALEIDTTAPDTPVLLLRDDSGTPGDGITGYNSLVLTGTAEGGSLLTLFDGGVQIGQVTTQNDGLWFSDTTTLQEGTHHLTAVAADAAGNSSTAAALTLTIDTAPPAAPSLGLEAGSDSGVLDDGITHATSPVLGGTTEASARVVLWLDGALLASVTADAGGNWHYDSSLGEGTHHLTAVAVDVAGNSGNSGTPAVFDLTIDATSPAAPTLGLAEASESGPIGDGITYIDGPVLEGMAEAGATVVLSNGGAVLATVTAGNDGTWSYDSDLGEGTYSLSAVAVDAADNSSAAGDFTLTIDRTAPTVSLDLATDSDSAAAHDHITRLTSPTLTGTAEAGATLLLLEGTTQLGQQVVGSSGSWSFDTGLGAGTHHLTLQARDAADNVGSHNYDLTIDTGIAAPTLGLFAADDSGPDGDGITSTLAPRLTGTAEAGATVYLYDGVSPIGTATADGNGLWSFTTGLGEGSHALLATALDAAGNSASTAFSLTIDTTPPAAPTLGLAEASEGGAIGDGITYIDGPVLEGMAEAGATIVLSNGGAALATVTAGTDGAWSYDSDLGEGTYSLAAVAVDAAGNSSAAGGFGLTIDTTPPAPPSVGLRPDTDSGAAGDARTNTTTPVLTGTAEAGGLILIADVSDNGGELLGTTTATGGAWSFSLSLAPGVHSLHVFGLDLAGLGTDAPFTLTIDTGIAAPTLGLFAADDSGPDGDGITSTLAPRLTGTAEAGATVYLYDGVSPIGTATADGNGLWSFTTGLGEGSHALLATALDAVGNSGDSGTPAVFDLTIDATPPAAPTLGLAEASEGGAIGDGITYIDGPLLEGMAEAGATIVLSNGGAALATVTAGTGGAWSYDSDLGEGTYSLAAVAVDAAGNSSAAGDFILTIDTGIAAPTLGLFAADDSGPDGDGITSTLAPRLTGTAEAGATVYLYDGVSPIGTTTADGNGLWSFTTGLGEGSHALLATALDAAGNSASTAFSLTIDTTPPATPTLGLATADDSGPDGDGFTIFNAPVLTGTAEAGSLVTLRDGGTEIGSATAGTDGHWSFTSTLGNGAHALTATAEDAAGHTSMAGSFALTIDARLPAPAVFTVRADSVDTLWVTNGTPGAATLMLDDTGQPLAIGYGSRAYALGDGTALFFSDGDDSIWVTDGTDAGTHPWLPGVDGRDFTALGNGLTLFSLNGGAPNAAQAMVTDGHDVWALTPELAGGGDILGFQALGDGRAIFSVKYGAQAGIWVTDGTYGGTSILQSLERGGLSARLGDGRMLFSGTSQGVYGLWATDGVAVDRLSDSTVLTRLTSNFCLLGDGRVAFIDNDKIWITDGSTIVSGATASAGSAILFDPFFPILEPSMAQVGDGRVVFRGIDSNNGPMLWVADLDAHSTSLVPVIFPGNSFRSPIAFSAAGDGRVLFSAYDAVHGQEVWITDGTTAHTSLLVDLTAATQPTRQFGFTPLTTVAPTAALSLDPASDTGAADNITAHTAVTVTGTAGADALVHLWEGSVHLGSTLAGPGGHWSIATTLTGSAAGTVHHLTSSVQQGSLFSALTPLDVTVDTSVVTPSLALAHDSGSSGSDGVTNDGTVTGATASGATVVLFSDGVAVGSAVAAGGGQWSIDGHLAGGIHSLQAVATDALGNSAASVALTVTLDTTPPVPPLISGVNPDSGHPADGITSDHSPQIFGTADPGSLITITLDDGHATHLASGIVAGDGHWSIDTTMGGAALADGIYAVTAVATDLAGNVSAASAGFTLQLFSGDLTLVDTANAQTLYGDIGNDTLISTFDDAHLLGGGGDDNITVGGLRASIDAGSGDDVITVTTVGGDTIDGGSGNDSVSYNFHAVDAVLERAPDGSIHLTHGGHTDILQNIESIHFLDGAYHPKAALIGDSDHDFHAEIALQRGTAGLVQLGWLNANALGSQELQDTAPGSLIGHADFDGDGKSDLLFRAANGDLSIWTMDGTTHAGTIAGFGTLGAALQLRGIGDTNGDGFNDLVLRDTDSGKISVWTQQGGSVTGQWDLGTVDTAWDIKAVGDFNGDGQADIMFQHASTDYLWLWELGGPGQPQILTNGSRGLGGPTHDWQLQDSGDFDGDGRTDLLWQNSTTNELYIWAMEGNAIKRNLSAPGHEDLDIGLQGHVGFAAAGQQVAGVAEMTGDGRYDIVLRAADGALSIWQMNGLTVLQQFNNIANPGSDWHLV